ncbi:Signal transduction histidine kinase containing a receiver domain (Hybrid) [Cupriavidus taiwanensis]|uniref:hybrid sensor histidine kinase/response regulator n=1 Tax=Cupriavidus taiwanensis TaxID=164546 RepID=UPI000E156011|nr:hybrid sensor histidine kinase/response regulator [Cupriavidus taiwanensis]SPA00445.1 Signal transduction histidine kinase containing a receiver domain (Hybrid) [Cupriavidus taiwanensis]
MPGTEQPSRPAPVQDADSVARNLQRERRVFSMVILLLGLLAMAIAAATVLLRLNGSLRSQEQVARLYEQGVVDAVLERRSTLTASNLILELHANGTFPRPRHQPASGLCAQAAPSAAPDDVLQRSCDQAVRTLTAASQKPSIEMISIASGATYRYEAPGARQAPALMPASLLTGMVLQRLQRRDPDLLHAAREKTVAWLAFPARAPGEEAVIVGASLVATGNELYAIVLTRIPLQDLLRPAGPNLSIPEPIVFDSRGIALVDAGARADAQRLDARLEAAPDGLFHWVRGYGWALRRPPLVADFGHLIFALPLGQQFQAMREELLVIGLITAVLVASLFAMYRYWNYRFLTATYAEAARAQQMLHEARLASEAAGKAKVAFFASMSHEIRTPLSSLLGNMELVSLGALEPEQRARVSAMQVSAEGLLQIVNDVLDFSKLDVGALSLAEEPVSVTELLGRIAISHAPLAAQRQLSFLAVYGKEIPARLRLDPVRLAQIINNLLGNAFKFTRAGKIVLRAQWVDQHLEIVIADTGVGIPDQYKGRLFQPFSQVDDNRLAQARGTGLGLSICRRLVERMNGRITLDSILGVGTRVTVRLPLGVCGEARPAPRWRLPPNRTLVLCREPECLEGMLNHFDWGTCLPSSRSSIDTPVDKGRWDCLLVAEAFDPDEVMAWWGKPASIVWLKPLGPLVAVTRPDGGLEVSAYSLPGIFAAAQAVITKAVPPLAPAGQSAPARREAPAVPLAGLSVLVAEDNRLNRSLLRDQLQVLGATVVEAGNGNEAMAVLSERSMDAVLTDIDMPVMNGFELLREIQRRHPQVPVYAVSASARPEDVAQGRASGFTGYLTKPVALAALASVLAGVAAPAGNTFAHAAEEAAAWSGDDDLPDLPRVPAGYAEAFLAQTRADLEALGAARAGRDVPSLERLLHRVAGTLAVLGRSGLGELCEELRSYAADAACWDDEIELQSAAILQGLGQVRDRLDAGAPESA